MSIPSPTRHMPTRSSRRLRPATAKRGGVDVHVARSFSLGVTVGYNWMMDFSEPLWTQRNFNGAQVALGIGWLWGKGY